MNAERLQRRLSAIIAIPVTPFTPDGRLDEAAYRENAERMVANGKVHQPVHPYLSPEGWLAYHQQIAQALPECALIPYLRNPAIEGKALRALAGSCPQFLAIKYAVANPLMLAAARAALPPGRITWICGLAELWTPFFWVAGARGFTSGPVNVRTDFSKRMLDCLRQGNYAGAQ